MASLTQALLVDFGFQAVAGLPAILLRTERWYDLTGSLTFLALAVGSFLQMTPGRDATGSAMNTVAPLVQTLCVAIWAARLGSHLFRRILQVRGQLQTARPTPIS